MQNWQRLSEEDRSGALRMVAALALVLLLPSALIFPGYTLTVALFLAIGGLAFPTLLSAREENRARSLPAAGTAIEERQEAAA